MSSSTSNKTPKSLADVSHLFFSSTEEEPEREAAMPASASPAVAVSASPGVAASASQEAPAGSCADVDRAARWERTKLFVVTGGNSGPGKSTVAVNLAHAFMSTGSVGVFDADSKIPNARFYMGTPSWNYLSPLVGEGQAAPTVRVDSGIVAVDCTGGGGRADEFLGRGESVYVDVDGDGRERLSCAVIDLAIGRAAWLAPILDRVGLFVVVARPGWAGFSEAFSVLARLRRDLGVKQVGLTVNMVPDNDYAARFFSKMRVAAERLLSMDVHFLGGMVYEENLGREQRERGSIVRSRPEAVFALMLREAASKALGSEWSGAASRGRWNSGTEI